MPSCAAQVVVGYVDAILGGTARVPTIHGHAQLAIPPGTQAGQRLSLRGAGITPDLAVLVGEAGPLRLGAGRAQRGDHHFTVVLLLPTQARCATAYPSHPRRLPRSQRAASSFAQASSCSSILSNSSCAAIQRAL